MSTDIKNLTRTENARLPRRTVIAFLAFSVALSLVGGQYVQAQAAPALTSNVDVAAPVTSQPATSAAQPAASSLADSNARAVNSDEYVISPEDVLEVYVYDVPELSRDFIVNSAGNVTVPLLPKPVPAAGLSPDQLARSLEQGFRQTGSLSHPQITVSVKQSKRSVVTVEGAVRTPQVLPISGRTKLTSVLSQCGGLADDAGSTVTITRGSLAPQVPSSGSSATGVVSVEIKKLTDGNDDTSRLEVWPGDRVSVEHAGVFYVLGEVNHPGGFNLKSAQEQVTVLQALAIAGDVTSISKKNKAVLIRKSSAGANGREEVALNVTDILAGRSPDHTLQANDILYVPASNGRRALRAITTSATTIAGGAGNAVVYRR